MTSLEQSRFSCVFKWVQLSTFIPSEKKKGTRVLMLRTCTYETLLFAIHVYLFCSFSLPFGRCVSPISVFACSKNGVTQALML